MTADFLNPNSAAATEPAGIHILPDHVINQIAAGEVVARPASVLKELIENAIDAGAARIDVEVIDGGRTLVSVADDGLGMSKDNALLALERHATSKIKEADDIEAIQTLGFRGEALAAIAAVAKFKLRTRLQSALTGTEIIMAAGKVQSVKESGCAPGTMIEVRNLFYNVPARRKFLRSIATESDHMRQTFMTAALARADIGFTLTANQRRLYSLPAKSDLKERLQELNPGLRQADLRPIKYSLPQLALSGYAGLPSLSRRDRYEQYIYVNGRPASAPLLGAAIRSAYQGVLSSDRHPILYLFIEIDPGLVDVNVHPAKKEVRFRDPGLVRHAVIAALADALTLKTGPGMVSDAKSCAPAPTDDMPEKTDMPAMRQFLQAMQSRPSFYASPRSIRTSLSQIAAYVSPAGNSPELTPLKETSEAKEPWAWYRLLGFVGNRYAVLETDGGLTLLDPHAAHERVLYERFRKEYQTQAVAGQALLEAVTLTLQPADASRVRHSLELLRQMGFGIAEFGGDAFVIDAVPACLPALDPAVLITEIAAYQDNPATGRAPLDEQAMRAACHAAVKASQPLDLPQLEILLEQLIQTNMPYTCPHGRPTLIHLSLQELNRKFGRE